MIMVYNIEIFRSRYFPCTSQHFLTNPVILGRWFTFKFQLVSKAVFPRLKMFTATEPLLPKRNS